MVRNEKNSRGDSIAERYGPPVTASDIEDLMYRERVPSGTIYKIMQAVRQALSWNRATAIRPWAGDLEDGLTRQEDRRAEQRRARLAEELREEGRRRAAAAEAGGSNVNSPREALAEVLADAWATAAAQDAPGSPSGATLRLVQGGAGTITPERVPEAPRAVPAPPEEVRPIEVDVTTVREAEMLARLAPAGMPMVLRPPAVSKPPLDAPAPVVMVPVAVANPAWVQTPAPAPPDAPAARSEAQEAAETLDDVFAELRETITPTGEPRKRCSKCGVPKVLDDFQRDKRASDGRRPSCKLCSSKYDEMRRNLKKSLVKAVDVAVDEAEATEAEAESTLREMQVMYEIITQDEAAELQQPTEVIIPRFNPPVEEETPDPDGMRVCKACDILKPADEYYTRSDGRMRFKCKECEKRESRERKAARGVHG